MIRARRGMIAIGILAAVGLWTSTWAFDATAAGTAEGRKDDSETAELRTLSGLEQQLKTAVLEGDVATFDKLFADDLTHTSQNGRFRTKPEWMNGRVQGKTNYVSFDVENVQIRLYGEAAIVTGVLKPSWREDDGTIATGRFRFLRVWAKRGGGWQVVAFQGTKINEEPD